MKKLSYMALLFLGSILTVNAQNEMQALRFSQFNPFGTARYAAQGGAIGALGGDFTSVLTNPAGLGLYRSSEFSFSPSFYWVNTSSDFQGAVADESRLKFNLGSIGMVNAMTRDRSSGIVGAAFALGYNTLVNFTNSTTIRGISRYSSMLDDFTWHANADPDNLSPFYEQLAFDTYLMPYDETSESYWHDMQLDGYGQQLYRSSLQSGYIGEYSISGAFNFSNLLYFGGTVGFHSVRFYEDIYHSETDQDNHVLDFDSFRFREYNSTNGWGYTARFGMIFRPIQMLRIGASFQLPTYYRLTDEKYTDMDSYWDSASGIQDASEGSPNGIYDYKLKTPFRTSAHVSLILFKLATVSAGYEYADYSAARLSAYDYPFIDENDEIRQAFQAVHNLKAGAEIRLGTLYVRAGGQYLMSPFTDSRNNAESWVYSGGLGVRTPRVFFDLSYTHSATTEVYGMYAYEPGANEISVNDINGNNLMFTVGFKF
ncbi:MAG: hypothetical protein P1P86_09670 [Bacteroidales bacterium]|nr:hypothetical protein [Bacteroidales bacterium]